MTVTAAEIGYGVLLKMLTSTGPDVYTILGNQRDVTPPGLTMNTMRAEAAEPSTRVSERASRLSRSPRYSST